VARLIRFGGFELDLETADLRNNGRNVRLPEQQFLILRLLLERNGSLLSRDEIRRQLWPNDTVVEFDRSINAAIMKLRITLGDTADKPSFIETLARRGYRFIIAAELDPPVQPESPRMHTQPGSLVGTRVLHYRILNVLGGGGMGLVYRGEDLHLNRPVALKFLPDEFSQDPRALARFAREARSAASLNHPNVCTIYQVEEHNGQPFIVMELLEGETLRATIARSAETATDKLPGLPMEMALDVSIQMLEGLRAAHEIGIIHRDIKPANVFITRQGRVKILDFGLAKANAPDLDGTGTAPFDSGGRAAPGPFSAGSADLTLTRAGPTMGTAGYMSPEQIRGEKMDSRTDLFSFGLNLFEMVTGQRAFPGDAPAEVQAAILQATPVPIRQLRPSTPTELENIVVKCLEKDRSLRYQHASQVLEDLLKLQQSHRLQLLPSGATKAASNAGDRFLIAAGELPAHESAASVPEHRLLSQDYERQAQPWLRTRISFLTAGAVFLTAMAAVLALALMPAPAPRVAQIDRLTRSGRAWWAQRILTDGARFYFVERVGGRQLLASAPVDGGDPVLIPTPFLETVNLRDISPDHTKLLLAFDDREAKDTALWIIPVAGGSPRRLGILSSDAGWLPDGRRIIFTHGYDIYSANEDGSDARKLSTVNGRPWGFHWSPDHRVLRFTVENPETSAVTIWEASADGTHAHPWSAVRTPPQPGWLQGEAGGVWTPDGKYFVYRSMRGASAGLWAIREQSGLLGRFNNKPFLLYTFPGGMAYLSPIVSSDGKRIVFVAEQESRELMRYDRSSQRSVPYLGGIPARMVDSSRDDQWAVYYSNDYRLWRSRVDGSDRLQLTFSPLSAGPARWSPDGRSIAFRGDLSSVNFRIYLISPQGGTPKVISPGEFTRASTPCWAPDGRSLIFGEMPPLQYSVQRPEHPMQRIDMQTGEVAALPGSEGLNAQGFSPEGQNIVAFAQNDSRLVVFNLASSRVTELARGKDFYAAFWSRDGKYIYFQDLGAGSEQPVYRIRFSDHKIETIAGLSQFGSTDAMAFSFAGLTSDDSPLASVIHNRGDIYALNVEFH
jgi:serine/threonine protein kinase/Tol biopolymer transport system component